MRTSLLTAIDATSHIHLIIGTNAVAAARCAKSLEVGATPIVIFNPEAWEHEVHPALQQRIDDKEVKWLSKAYHDDDISTLGRPELNGYVDAVFVTLSPRDPLSESLSHPSRTPHPPNTNIPHQVSTSQRTANAPASPSTSSTPPPSAPSPSFPHTPTAPSKSA